MSKNETPAQAGNVKTDGTAFLAALAAAIWDIHKARRISRSVGTVLAHFGIEVPEDTATNAEAPAFKLPTVGPDPDDHITYSVSFKDLGEAAQAKLRTEAVKSLRRQAYDYFRSQVEDYGRYNVVEVTRHFGKLAFPMPDTQTSVSGMIRQGDRWETISTTLAGTVTTEQARDAMTPLASHSPGYLLAQQAFPEGKHDESLTREVYAHTESVWKPLED